ncbi:SIMPL domain-containing protein [Sphingomicrobium sediminis]|uniref:SIMPL domain-containing protein n=1 Tax=Sphingomicrobium sediminis TaxID=2950949 RepID=A0A9X2EGZ4_9SPHN|nr:SIMPL domain-containing protein [Sphingomicrobium sediminis]MCM8557848.1 SIMPL domain-containing protein [Sphingomicrobium sediminis]
MRSLALIPPTMLAACSQAEADPRGVDRDETLLTVSATGQSESRPDEARFSLGVETIARSAETASRLNAEKMQEVMAALAEFEIPEDKMQTSNLSVGRIDYGPNRGRYRAYNILAVRMSDVDRAGDAVTATTNAGGNLVSGPQLTQSDPEAAMKAAYADAYNNARLRADAYAEAAGLQVSRILTIRDGGNGYRDGVYSMNDAMVKQAATAPPPPPLVRTQNVAPFQPGTNQSRVSVTVAFALKLATS